MSESQENIQMDVEQSQQQNTSENPTSLTDIEVKDENVALNLFVSFLNLAQRRGAFNMQESSKIWECIQKFQKQGQQ
jgi:hypothetical protein